MKHLQATEVEATAAPVTGRRLRSRSPEGSMPVVRNGWTAGQYSLFRMFLGGYLTLHFAALVPYGPELFASSGMLADPGLSPLYGIMPNVLGWMGSALAVRLLLAGATGLALAFALGFRDRAAALLLWYVLACLIARNPLIANPSLPYVGWLLLAHASLPCVPFGGWDARSRPLAAWAMPEGLFAVAWIVMVVGYTYSGYTKLISPSWLDGSALARVLQNPLARPTWIRDLLVSAPASVLTLATSSALALELSAAPLALFRALRPWLWLSLLGMHVGLLCVLDFADLTFGMLVLHAFTFDPAWIPSRRIQGPDGFMACDRVYYDGECGMCQGVVRFLAFEDLGPGRLRFAPLHGATFESRVSAAQRARLPDSLVVETADERVLTRSEAVLYLLERLGGLWRLLALGVRWLPRRLCDALYDGIATRRRESSAAACPVLPAALRVRFDA